MGTAQRREGLCLVGEVKGPLGAWIYCYVMLPCAVHFHWMKVSTAGLHVTIKHALVTIKDA